MGATTALGQRDEESWLSFTPDRDIWHSGAPQRIRLNYQSSDDEAGWLAWQKHLRRRRRPVLLRKILPWGRRNLLLARADDELGGIGDHIELLCSLGRHPANDVHEMANTWLDQQPRFDGNVADILEPLAWCQALPRLALQVPATTWWRLLGRLIDWNASASRLDPNETPLAWQLLGGELALSLGYLFPELQARDDWRHAGQRVVGEGLEELISPEGAPHATNLAIFGELVACWTRSSAITDALPIASPIPAHNAFKRAVRTLARLTRCEHGEFSIALGGTVTTKLLKSAGRQCESRKSRAAVAKALGKKSDDRMPGCSLNSERAQTALLRVDWKIDSPRLALTYARRRVELELTSTEVLWSGEWTVDLERERQPLTIESGWDEICAESDSEVDYIELEARFSAGVRVQRHFLLAKADRLLLVADAILSNEPGLIDYCGVLPLAAGVCFQTSVDTTEGRLIARQPRVQVLPLALPEWSAERRWGTLQSTDRGLELRQSGPGPCLFSPLLLDLKSKRFNHPLTWRQLTVADQRRIVSPGEAVGYRVQLGSRQWLLYRSLLNQRTRSVLGQNVNQEFLLARFDAETGEADTLLEVEP
jgi:hypothetical protein